MICGLSVDHEVSVQTEARSQAVLLRTEQAACSFDKRLVIGDQL